MLCYADGRYFSQGACTFLLRPATERDTTPRIMVGVEIEGIYTQATVDTGGVYLLCNPEIAEELNLDPNSGLGNTRQMVRGIWIDGTLHRTSLRLLAEEGQSLELEVTAFIPLPDQLLDLPSMMGLMGCLEWLRFAVDPNFPEDPDMGTFHFGIAWEGN